MCVCGGHPLAKGGLGMLSCCCWGRCSDYSAQPHTTSTREWSGECVCGGATPGRGRAGNAELLLLGPLLKLLSPATHNLNS